MSTIIDAKRSLIRQAHALARSLGHTRDANDFLHDVAGVGSLLALDLGRLRSLCRDLRGRVESADRPHLVSEAQWRAVWALRRRLRMDDKQFAGIVKHVTGLDSDRFLDVASCRALITGMNKIADGKEAKGARASK